MKKNYFETLSTIISLTYKITFILSSIFGICFWLGFLFEWKKTKKGEEINKISNPEKEVVKDPNYDWKRDWNENIKPELDRVCKSSVYDDEDDRELY